MKSAAGDKGLPCPGISDPESLTPASRLIIDSVRSPNTDPKKLRNPKAIALKTAQNLVLTKGLQKTGKLIKLIYTHQLKKKKLTYTHSLYK